MYKEDIWDRITSCALAFAALGFAIIVGTLAIACVVELFRWLSGA